MREQAEAMCCIHLQLRATIGISLAGLLRCSGQLPRVGKMTLIAMGKIQAPRLLLVCWQAAGRNDTPFELSQVQCHTKWWAIQLDFEHMNELLLCAHNAEIQRRDSTKKLRPFNGEVEGMSRCERQKPALARPNSTTMWMKLGVVRA